MDLQSPRPVTTIRRNPPRRAKQTPSANAPNPSASSSADTAAVVAGIRPFPLDELLELETQPPKNRSSDGPENLKVFLRVRPLEIRPKPAKNPKPKPKPRGKPQAPSPKGAKSNKACLVVNDSSSVTLSAPPSVFDSKRSKSELYDGFSFVFPPESDQKEIYTRVMKPLLMDFMGGKSSLLAAMGPTGSGKTHTMFGSPREPGMVPLVLRHIFNNEMESSHSHASRSYFLSMFEIYSERGKGERIIDLSRDGCDLSFQQSAIKGLQEIRISDATHAESLVAAGLLKRATAATSANDQSSRSQCIINIRCALENISDENDSSARDAILTIADLAGAERERKTGNQGARLSESNFINNTSMVFGLCLRSLLEHQRNPKRSFEKHFQNSLLTRYLRDYLEGKKRMTLILTVKPGEDDYGDTSFLLRQASPYMKIKFNIVEEVPSVPRQKRNTASSFRTEVPKRRKVGDADAGVIDHVQGDIGVPSGCQILEKEASPGKLQKVETQEISNLSPEALNTVDADAILNKELQVELARMRRNDEVMRKFSKALWNVLKQYKKKLEDSENEVKNLKETIGSKINSVHVLKNELMELRSCCSCYIHPSSKGNLRPEVDGQFDHSACVRKVSSANHVDPKNMDARLINYLIPMPILQNPEISSTAMNESEVLGLSGILVETTIAGDSKSIFHSPVEQRSFIVERQKISAYDDANSSFTIESLEDENNQIAESQGVEHVIEHLESPSNFSDIIHSNLRLAEATSDGSTSSALATGDCSPVGKQNLFIEEPMSESFCDAGSSDIVEGFCGIMLENIQHEPRSFPEQDHGAENRTDTDSLSNLGKSCSRSSTGIIEHSGILVTSDQVDDNTSMLSSSDMCIMLLVGKAETSDTMHSTILVKDTVNQNTDGTCQGLEQKHQNDEGIENEQAHYSHNASLAVHPCNFHDAVDDERSVLHKGELIKEDINAGLDVSPIDDFKENEFCRVNECLKNGKPASTRTADADKPRRRLLPASTILLKEFNGLDMDADNSKENRTKPTAAVRGRSQGSLSLVRLLTGKQ